MKEVIKKVWKDYLSAIGEDFTNTKLTFTVDHFCDNKKDADELAESVVKGVKRATTSSLWVFERTGEELPKPGDYFIITDWDGNPKCIIKNISVDIIPFKDITEEYAEIEGEGDKSLEYWKKVHWEYYKRELRQFGLEPTEDMPVVCEMFEVVYC